MTPISRRRGPKINPPPEPSKPPTTQPTIPLIAQDASDVALHSIDASHMYSRLPVPILIL